MSLLSRVRVIDQPEDGTAAGTIIVQVIPVEWWLVDQTELRQFEDLKNLDPIVVGGEIGTLEGEGVVIGPGVLNPVNTFFDQVLLARKFGPYYRPY
jgi:hypothetical protein